MFSRHVEYFLNTLFCTGQLCWIEIDFVDKLANKSYLNLYDTEAAWRLANTVINVLLIILGAFALAAQAGKQGGSAGAERTQKDLPINLTTSLTILTLLAVFCFFLFLVPGVNLIQAVVGLAIVGCISFLFTTVAARAIAIVGTNPVSGMTLMTLIITSVASYFGYHVQGGAVEVGKSSTRAVVQSSILILLANLILTKTILQ